MMSVAKSSSAKRSKKISIQIRPVLSEDKIGVIPLTYVYSAQIIDKKMAKDLLFKLPPLPKSLSHLKRIRTTEGVLEIILGSALKQESIMEQNAQNIKIPLNDHENEFIMSPKECIETLTSGKSIEEFRGLNLSETSINLTKVASRAPVTRAQFEVISPHWPVNFNPDKILENLLLPNGGLSESEILLIQENMELVLEKSIESGGRGACLIYDSSGAGEVLVCTCGLEDLFPLRHAACVAVDQVSLLQGCTQLKTTEIYRYDLSERNKLTSDGVSAKLNNSSFKLRNRSSDYLCTGLHAYLSHESCLMCSMTLLHSRVNRIYYVEKNGRRGALESTLMIHTLPNINHRFNVFQISPLHSL